MMNEVYEALQEIETLMARMNRCVSTPGKANNGYKILEVMERCPAVKNYWNYIPSEQMWINRFVRNHSYKSGKKNINIYIKNGIMHDSSYIERSTPFVSGLYFIGNTTFDPFTDDKQYWVKIGQSIAKNGIHGRMRQYDSHSPATWFIDALPLNDSIADTEIEYHKKLAEVAIARSERSTEWFLVSRAVYLEMCEKGFAFFD
jgi:hypothetical protein